MDDFPDPWLPGGRGGELANMADAKLNDDEMDCCCANVEGPPDDGECNDDCELEIGVEIVGNKDARLAADALAAAVVGVYMVGSGLLDSLRSKSIDILNEMGDVGPRSPNPVASAFELGRSSYSLEDRVVSRDRGLE